MCCWQKKIHLWILVALSRMPGHATDATLTWVPSPNPAVVSYHLYYGGSSGNYTNMISADHATRVTVRGLIPQATYYFAVTVCSSSGLESFFSSEVSYRIPAIPPLPNQPPTLDAIGDLTLGVNAPRQTVNLTGITAGATNENQTLAITAVSSNPRLIPNPTVSYISPGNVGQLSFSPQRNLTGTCVISVTVSDGAANNNLITRTFTVTVTNSFGGSGSGGSPGGGGSTGGGTTGGHGTTRGARHPVLTGQLTNQVALAGQTRTFVIAATGSGRLTYQWNCNGTNLTSSTSPVLTLNNVTTNQSGVYSVTVTDRFGSTNSSASLTVYATAAGYLTPVAAANGTGKLQANGVPGFQYIVEASTDLVRWVTVQTNTAPFTFVDTAAGQFNQRFYRSVYAP